MRKNYEINFTAKTITITKAFSEKAQDFSSAEFKLYKQFQSDLPDFAIITSAPKARKKNSKITCQKDSTVLLKRFAEVRELSKSTSAPYNFVYKWFNATFPNYDELPEFDSNGNIIPQYDLTAADLILEEVKANVA